MELVSKSKTSAISRLKRERRYFKVLQYRLLTLSELARESVKNQGSARCMDLVYRNKAKGRFLVGKIIDRWLLELPVSKATRERRETVLKLMRKHLKGGTVLYVPCGTASELTMLASEFPDTKFVGVDLDTSTAKSRTRGIDNVEIHKLDAFDFSKYPVKNVDLILTIGLIDYLSCESTVDFYTNLTKLMKAEGVMITSAVGKHKHSDSLMKEFANFCPVYKTRKQLHSCLEDVGLKVRSWTDSFNIHSFAVAYKSFPK